MSALHTQTHIRLAPLWHGSQIPAHNGEPFGLENSTLHISQWTVIDQTPGKLNKSSSKRLAFHYLRQLYTETAGKLIEDPGKFVFKY